MRSSPEPLSNRAGYARSASLLLFGSLLWLWSVTPSWAALEYELKGVVRDEPRALDIGFEVCVRDCAWRI